MRTFLLRSILFSVPVLIALLMVELAMRAIPNDYSYKSSYWKGNAEDIEVLVLGSSHSYYGIDPDHFSAHGFNAAHVSQTIDLDRLILDHYADRLTKCRWIIVPISISTLFSELNRGKESWRLKYYAHHYDLSLPLRPIKDLELAHGTMAHNFGRIQGYLASGSNERRCSDLGYGTRPPQPPQDLERTGRTAAERHTKQDRTYLSVGRAHLEAIITKADEIGARVLLCVLPAHEAYRRHLDPEQWNLTLTTVEKLLDQQHVSYHDLMADPRFVDSDFHDADHLNSVGAERLTLMLDSIMRYEESK